MGLRRWGRAVVAAICLWTLADRPADAALGIVHPLDQDLTAQDNSLVAKVFAAYDETNQVYLVVWSNFATWTYGQFLNKNGEEIGGPFRITNLNSGYSRVVWGADGFLVTYNLSGGAASQRWGRFVRYVGGAPQLGTELYLYNNNPIDGNNGMTYVPSAGHYLLTYWVSGGKFRSFVMGVRGNGLVSVPATEVSDGSAVSQDSPEIACDAANNRCLIVGKAWQDPGMLGTWGRIIDASSGVPSGNLFYLDWTNRILNEDQKVAFSPSSGRYVVTWVRGRASLVGRRVFSDLSLEGGHYTVIGGNYGQSSLSHNTGSGTFAVAFKDGNNPAHNFVQELNVNGDVSGTPLQLSGIGTTGDGFPVTAPNPADKQFLALHSVNFLYGYGGVLSAAGGGTPEPTPAPAPPPTSPGAVTMAKADFNRDGKADLLWRRSDGVMSMWRMNGLTAAQQVLVNPSVIDPVWRIAGTGDLDGNGRPEILWQHTTEGWLCAWFMNDEMLTQPVYLNPSRILSNAWKIVAVADMNGDAKADLLWQHDSGWLSVWYMDGVTKARDEYLTPDQVAGNDWKIVGAGDMNGDGRADIIWQHTSAGWLSAWLMNGSVLGEAVYLSPNRIAGSDWKIRGVIDINGDGHTDLIWQHLSGGWVAAWLMNRTTAVSTPYLDPTAVSTSWTLVGPR